MMYLGEETVWSINVLLVHICRLQLMTHPEMLVRLLMTAMGTWEDRA